MVFYATVRSRTTNRTGSSSIYYKRNTRKAFRYKAFENFRSMAERQTGKTLQILRTVMARSLWICSLMITCACVFDIKLWRIMPPEQNELADRGNQTIFARSDLYCSKLVFQKHSGPKREPQLYIWWIDCQPKDIYDPWRSLEWEEARPSSCTYFRIPRDVAHLETKNEDKPSNVYSLKTRMPIVCGALNQESWSSSMMLISFVNKRVR